MGRWPDLIVALALAAPLPAAADPSCFGLCSIDCVKPISIPDRWDDFSVPGSTGWSGNGVWDSEKFTDTNGNKIHDPGEPFQDGSSQWSINGHGPLNGQFDAEYYDPLTTGYLASKDSGLEITLSMGTPSGGTHVAYYPCHLPLSPGAPTGTDGGGSYTWDWSNCNLNLISTGDRLALESGSLKGPTGQALRDKINQDPGAFWDDACSCVNSSMGDESPRVIIFAAQDPRIPLSAGGQSLLVSKFVGFFIESADVNANVKGRFVQIHRTGSNSCSTGGDFVVDCAVPTRPVTWGGVKATYR